MRLDSLEVNGADSVSFAYDDDSLLTSAGDLAIVREPDTGRLDTVTVGLVTSKWTYTEFGEPESITNRFDGAVIYAESFLYDKRGWITDLTRTQGGATVAETFGYDNRGRLETVSHDGTPVSTYGYDVNSNRTSYDGPFGTVTELDTDYDARDRLRQYGDTDYTYNEAGELTSKSANGQAVTYDYDVFGNLRQVSLPSGTTIDYVIDAAQRRIGKRVDGTLTRGWLYQDGLNPIAELDGAGNVVARFVYATRPNVPDYLIKNGTTYRVVSDHLGSPRLIVDIVTGVIVQELRYDAFGRITLDTNPGFQPFGFAGGLCDPQTGLVRFGARDYDPEMGRWTSVDPIGYGGRSANLYGYARNNPISFLDLRGQKLAHISKPLEQTFTCAIKKAPQEFRDAVRWLVDEPNDWRLIELEESGQHSREYRRRIRLEPGTGSAVDRSNRDVLIDTRDSSCENLVSDVVREITELYAVEELGMSPDNIVALGEASEFADPVVDSAVQAICEELP